MKMVDWFVGMISFMILALLGGNVYAVPSLKLPFTGGDSWKVTQGNSDDPANTPQNPNPTHTEGSGMEYAWDFSKQIPGKDCNGDLGELVVAPAAGTIVQAGLSGDWGNVVRIDYGDGSYGRLAHLLNTDEYPLLVKVGEKVRQGQPIGYNGNTGKAGGCAHIHYQTENANAVSIASSFSEVAGDGVPVEGEIYTSNNYFTPTTYFSFPNHSSEGWTCGFDTQNVEQTQADQNTWMVAADDFDGIGGTNPGVVSPSFAQGIDTDQFRIGHWRLVKIY